jgi:hypothetical protein
MAGADAVSVVQVFDRNGVKIAELLASCNRAWVRNAAARAQFTLSIFEPKCREDVLRFGNLVLIEHKKLPAWGGVIDTPREWGSGTVTVTAYSGLKLFEYRAVSSQQLLRGSAAALIRTICELAQQDAPLPIELGTLEDDRYPREETVGGNPLLDDLMRIVDRADGEIRFEPILSSGGLRFRVDYYTTYKAGETGEDLYLADSCNLNLEGRILIEQGVILNDLLGLGDGLTFESRPQYRETDEESITLYGRRQGVLTAQGVTQIGTLQQAVKTALGTKRKPEMVINLRVLDVGETWNRLRLGTHVTVQLTSAGFSNNAVGIQVSGTVIGMEYDEIRQTVQAIVEVLQ